MTGSRALLVALAVLVAPVATAGQRVVIEQRPNRPGVMPPPRDVAAEEGSGVLRGVVLGGENGRPLRRAVVRLHGAELREGRMASTDEQGRWELRDLPGGRFDLTASKAGYVSLQYGQRRPFERGRPVELRNGQTLDDVNFNLPRGAVISGRIVDEFGEPVAEAMVAAMRYRYFNGRRRLVPAGRFAQTDDLGHFRIYGLAPGEYYLSAALRGGMAMGMETDSRTGYAPTYYPGTGSPQQAQRITVPLGGEMSGITFPLMPVRTVRISGTATDSKGQPMAGAFVMLTETTESAGGMMMFSVGGGNRVRPDGSFTVSNVSPGEYMLQAQRMGGGRDEEVAIATVTVGSEDLSNVMLVATEPATLSGQIVFDRQPAAGAIKPGSIVISALPVTESGTIRMFRTAADGVNDDWTFELRPTQGPVLVRTRTLPPGYAVKEVLLNGQDVTDTAIEFRPGAAVSGLQVVLTARQSAVAGSATDGSGQPALDYAVVIFEEDSARWGFMSRYQAMARPDQQGAFEVKGLPPGRYLAAALEYLEDGQEGDPEFLERLRTSATPFTLAEGEQKALQLTLVTAY